MWKIHESQIHTSHVIWFKALLGEHTPPGSDALLYCMLHFHMQKVFHDSVHDEISRVHSSPIFRAPNQC